MVFLNDYKYMYLNIIFYYLVGKFCYSDMSSILRVFLVCIYVMCYLWYLGF